MPPQINHKPSRIGSVLSLFFSLLLIVAAMWAIINRQLIVDYITVWQNQPSATIEQLADRSDMSDKGRFLFYASTPQISDRQNFIKQCGGNSEQTAILGCYTDQRIFIFDVNDPRLDGIKEVTAAHEMLHAVYDRLSAKERDELDLLVEDAYKHIDDERLDELVRYYDRAEPGHRHNELHAILGTEYEGLSEKLESHYRRYFNDRTAVVKLANDYQKTFEDLTDSQQKIIDDLGNLSSRIESATETYNQSAQKLSDDIANFNNQANNGHFDNQFEFDTARANLVSRQSSLLSEQKRIQSMIDQYERQRKSLEEINLIVEDLNYSINANLSEAPKL